MGTWKSCCVALLELHPVRDRQQGWEENSNSKMPHRCSKRRGLLREVSDERKLCVLLKASI